MKRIASALVLIPLVTYLVLWGPPWLCLLVIAVVAFLCFHEYAGIVAGYGIQPPGPAGYAAGLLILLVQQKEILTVTLLALAALTLTLFRNDLSKGLPRAAALLFGIIYIFGAWRAGFDLLKLGRHWLFFVLVLNWIGDTVAYYVGGLAGRHKLAPRLSPAKSWEGSVASLLASVAFGILYLGWALPSVSLALRVALSTAGNIAGQIGDLAESAMKRGAGMKDSGRLLPGHGGWLDRVDSTLFAMPVICLLVDLPWLGLTAVAFWVQ